MKNQLLLAFAFLFLYGISSAQESKLDYGLALGFHLENLNGTGLKLPGIYEANLNNHFAKFGLIPGAYIQYQLIPSLALRLDARYRQNTFEFFNEGLLRVAHLELPLTVNFNLKYGIGLFAGVAWKRTLHQQITYIAPESFFRTDHFYDALMRAYRETQSRVEWGMSYRFGAWSLRLAYNSGLTTLFTDVQLGLTNPKTYTPAINNSYLQITANYSLVYKKKKVTEIEE